MTTEPWGPLAKSLAVSLSPLLTNLNHADLIALCLNKRSELMSFVNAMAVVNENKSFEMSYDFMKMGDKFLSSSLEKCLSLYTESIIYAPNNSHLSAAYVKRSLVLLNLGYYNEASHDIKVALSNALSRKNSFRKVLQLLHIGDYRKARAILYETMKKLKFIPPGLSAEEESMILGNDGEMELKQNMPTVKNGENPDFPSSSNCLGVSYDNKKGRYVLAKCDIKAGDVLFVEKAFAFTIANPYCNWCCQKSIAPIPCLSCVAIYFCSEQCRNSAWESYHKFECGFSNLLRETGPGYLALRIIFKGASDFGELKAVIKSFSSKKKLQGNPVTFSESTYENVYYLQSGFESMNILDVLSYSLTATLLALYLVHHTKYAKPTDENIKLLGGILLHHISQIGCNGHTISVEKITELMQFVTEGIGGGIYPSVSMMNHSCEPSIITSFHNDVLIVRACKDISKGEEVFNSYVGNFREMRKSERQDLLQRYYFFDCNCSSCSQEHDTYDLLNSLQCEECKGPLVLDLKSEVKVSEHEQSLRCVNCDVAKVFGIELSLKTMQYESYLRTGWNFFESGKDLESALHAFSVAWRISKGFLYKLHRSLLYSAQMVGSSNCLYLLKDFKRCIAFLKCTVLLMRSQRGHLSMDYALEMKKLSDCILFHYMDVDERKSTEENGPEIKSMITMGLQYYDDCANIIKLFYGEEQPLLTEVQINKALLQNLMSSW